MFSDQCLELKLIVMSDSREYIFRDFFLGLNIAHKYCEPRTVLAIPTTEVMKDAILVFFKRCLRTSDLMYKKT